jgi:hypothetical protein
MHAFRADHFGVCEPGTLRFANEPERQVRDACHGGKEYVVFEFQLPDPDHFVLRFSFPPLAPGDNVILHHCPAYVQAGNMKRDDGNGKRAEGKTLFLRADVWYNQYRSHK